MELEDPALERVKALRVPTRSCLGDASGWATVGLRGCLGCRIGVSFLGPCDIIGSEALVALRTSSPIWRSRGRIFAEILGGFIFIVSHANGSGFPCLGEKVFLNS